jgi:hypothetical protein
MFNQQQCFIYSTASFLSKLRAKKVEKLRNSSYNSFKTNDSLPEVSKIIRAEGNNTKWDGKKRFNGSVNHRLRKEHVFSPPFLDKVRSNFFLLMVICNLLLLSSKQMTAYRKFRKWNRGIGFRNDYFRFCR